MVLNDFFNHEIQEFFGEGRVQVGVSAQRMEPFNLGFFAFRVAGRQVVFGLEPTNLLGAFEAFCQEVHQGGIDIVDTGTDGQEFFQNGRFGGVRQ